jgi:hypothetical protein
MTRVEKTDELLIRTFAKLDPIALGISIGVVSGLGLFLATNILLLKGGVFVGKNLSLLAQYFPFYSVTWTGSLVGAFYGCFVGFLIGWSLAFVRNMTIASYLHAIRLWTNLSSDHFLDPFDS